MENTSENHEAEKPDGRFERICRCVRSLCHQSTSYITTLTAPMMGEAPMVGAVIRIVEDAMMILEATLPMLATVTPLACIGYTIRTVGWSVLLGLQFLRGTPQLILRDYCIFFDFYTNFSIMERILTITLSFIL